MMEEFGQEQIKSSWYKNLFEWLKKNIFVILLVGLILCSNRLFYVLARAVCHNVYISPADEIDVSIPFERNITLNTFTAIFVIPYFFCYLYWIFMPFVIYKKLGKKQFYRLAGTCLFSFVISFFIFAFIPTKQNPDVYGQAYYWVNADHTGFNKLTASILKLVYAGDCPDNLCPSFHILCTFLCFLFYCFKSEEGKFNKTGFWCSLVFFIVVACSVICTRQHCLIDIIFGVCLGIVGMYLSDITKLDEGIYNLNTNFNQAIVKNRWWLVLWFIIFAVLVYFGIISLVTGDPLKGTWKPSWQPEYFFN